MELADMNPRGSNTKERSLAAAYEAEQEKQREQQAQLNNLIAFRPTTRPQNQANDSRPPRAA